MIRNRVSWGFGLMALLVLTLGMAACGGSEPAPVVQPPAPPPAPPPFQPQAVEVALGEAGGNITLMTTESGGFTLNGELFESGGSVVAENGSTYLLILADGSWNAAYQAMEIMVTLGITEETVALTRAEDGTYWLGDAAVQSGVTMATASNGNVYTLMITTDDAGMIAWQATYVEPVVNVMLGLSGEVAMIKKSEDGSYWLGDVTVTSGETMATAANGNTYTLVMADGEWSAAYVAMTGMVTIGGTGLAIDATRDEAGSWTAVHPLTGETITLTEGGMVTAGDNQYMLSSDGAGSWTAAYVAYSAPVMLGTSGTITLVRAEDGTYWHGDALVENGSMVTAMNGNEYELMMDDAGMWSATYVQYEAMVMLGISGTTIALVRAEDGTYWHGDALVENGSIATAVNGDTYTLMMMDGVWMASYNQDMQTFALGSSGSSVTLVQIEDKTWWDGDVEIVDGSTVTAENGNVYTVTMEDGAWSSAYMPETMEIMGTGLTASSMEDGTGYDVSGSDDTLGETGMGDVTSDGAMYHVWMNADGMLAGARFDSAISGDTDQMVGHLGALPTLSADDDDTAANEKGTMLNVAGDSYSIGSLLDAGAADASGGNFIANARDEIEKIRDQVALLVEAFDFDGASSADKRLLSDQLGKKWSAADNQIQKVFPGQELTRELDDDDVVDAFDDVLDALSSMDAFEAAVRKGDDGVFDNFLEDTGMTAENVFEATASESRVIFGIIGDTRFGTVAKKERSNAISKLKHALGDEDGVGSMGAAGAFAYATIDDTVRTHHIQTSGNATYMGETRAVSGDGTLYSGDIEIEVRFRSSKVSGLVSNLESEEGEAWHYLVGDVDSILLPTANLTSTASWTLTKGGEGYANYAPRPGSPGRQEADSTFAGHLLGTGEDAGNQTVGVWSFGNEDNQAKRNYISGGFGAMRTESTTGPTEPDTGDGTETVSIPGTGRMLDADGTDVDLGGRKGTRLLGASLGDGYLTILGTSSESANMSTLTPALPVLETFQVPLSTAFDKAGSVFWTNSATQVSLARAEIEALRNRLEGFSRLDEDAVVRAEKTKLWDEIIAVLGNRIFTAGRIKRAAATDDGAVVMEAVDALGYKFADDGGSPDATGGFADINTTAPNVGKLPDQSTPWRVLVEESQDGDPSGHTRIQLATDATAQWVIADGDLMTLTVYDAWQLALAGDPDTNTDPDPTATPGTVLAPGVKLVNQLVNASIAEIALGGATYPTRTTGGTALDDTEALSKIDDVLQALSSQGALDDALARGGALEYLNRSETAGGDPEDPGDDGVTAVGDIWGRKEARVQVQLGTTSYTRFGVWRKQVNKSAANDGYKNGTGGSDGGEVMTGAFAYSSVPGTEYESAADSTYPGGGSATYPGETVALQLGPGAGAATYYTGVIEVTASWEPEWMGRTEARVAAAADGTDLHHYYLGAITAVISGLETPDGDPLYQNTTAWNGGADNPDTDAAELGYLSESKVAIRDIVFTGVDITTLADEDKNGLSFDESFVGDDTATAMSNATARVRLVTMVGDDPITVAGPGVVAGHTAATANLVGTFVGQDVDGPLGLIGRWTVHDPTDAKTQLSSIARTPATETAKATEVRTYELDNVDAENTATPTDFIRLGSGSMIHGAFGAEVEP